MNNRLTSTIDPWYRHRWPWLLMLGPFIVVVPAAVTDYLAVISNDGLVDGDYYKQGLAINQITARDQVASRLGLQAELMLGADSIRVLVSSKEAAAPPDHLVLHFTHPTRSGVDQSIALSVEPGHGGLYSGKLQALPIGRWHVVLEDGGKEWRLTGGWKLGEAASVKLLADPPKDGGSSGG